MRIGSHVFGYHNAEEWAQLHLKYGYGAAYWPLEIDAPQQQVEEYLSAAQRHDLVIAEIGAWNNLLDRDPAQARKNLEYNVRALQLADRLGACCCVNITGSLSDSWDGPHPHNMDPATFDRVVENIRYIIDTAAPQRVDYTVEPMPWMIPNSIQGLQELIDAVDRPHFAVHADLCNLVNSFDKLCDNTALIQEFFDRFDTQIRAVHAKDIALDGKLTLGIREVLPGDGVLDLDLLLRRCEAVSPDLPVMTEHLAGETEYIQAGQRLIARANALGIYCKTGR